jgi:hypothetical protein
VLTDKDILFAYNGIPGVPLVWVIDSQCLYDTALSQEHSRMFLECDNVIDISQDYPEHDGITVRFLKESNKIEDFQTSEYFGSILLSNPSVLNLLEYPYGRYVESPHAKFINNEFVITNRDVTGLLP